MEVNNIDIKSKEISNTLESIENNMNNFLNGRKISDEIRGTYLKIKAMNRDQTESKLEKEYEKLLGEYENLLFQEGKIQWENNEALLALVDKLDGLEDKDGNKLINEKIDGGIIQGAIALKEGVSQGCEIIINDLKQTLETLVSPEEWEQILEGLKYAIQNPIEFFENIIDFIKKEYKDIAKDFHLYEINSTKSGFAIEMGEFVPKTCLPIIIGSIGTGKFTSFMKLTKIDKYIPEKVIKKLSHNSHKPDAEINIKPQKKEILMELEDSHWDFKSNTKPDSYTIRNKFVFINRIEKIITDKEMFIETMKNPQKLINFHKSINNMTQYLEEMLPIIHKTGATHVKQHLDSLTKMKTHLIHYYKNNPTNKGLLILAKAMSNEQFENVYESLNKIHKNLSN